MIDYYASSKIMLIGRLDDMGIIKQVKKIRMQSTEWPQLCIKVEEKNY